MKKVILILFGIIILLFSCNNIDYMPKYFEFENAWERENLIGKVKTLEQYKAYFTDLKTRYTSAPVIVFKKEFTDFGELSYQEYFDKFGELQQYTKNKFDEDSKCIEKIIKDVIIESKYMEKMTLDSTGKLISAEIFYNDSITYEVFFEYDINNNITKTIYIENSDTTISETIYIYDDNKRIINKEDIFKGENEENISSREFAYNQNGSLIEMIDKSDYWGELKTTYKYDDNDRIEVISRYDNDKIREETYFDKYFNQILGKYYENESIIKEIKYEYKFDRRGNWIKRTALLKEDFIQDTNYIPAYIETRKIKYY